MRTRIWKLTALALALLLALTGCSLIEIDQEMDNAEAVATVNGVAITKGEVKDTYAYYQNYYAYLYYYYTGSSTFYDYYWYLAVKNNPPNGPGTTEQEGCHWFLRDSVLFVGIDSLIHKGSRMTRYGDKTNVLRDQTNWFDRVVSEQKNRKSFRYLVVVQHDPWFVCSSDGFKI